MATVLYPGPGLVELDYSVDGLSHVMTFSVIPDGTPVIGDPADEILIFEKDGQSSLLSVRLDALRQLLDGIFDTAVSSFNTWNFYMVTPSSFERTLITSYSTGTPTFSASPYNPAYSEIYTFRTLNGGIGKVTLLETIHTSKLQLSPSQILTAQDAIAIWFTDNNTPAVGRDNGYFHQLLRVSGGENEHVFKRRYRS